LIEASPYETIAERRALFSVAGGAFRRGQPSVFETPAAERVVTSVEAACKARSKAACEAR